MWKRLVLGLAGFGCLLAAWSLGALYVRAARTDLSPEVIERLYPLPYQVLRAAAEIPVSESLQHVWQSTCRVLIGFVIAALVALPVGCCIGRLRIIGQLLEPANDFLRYLPVAGFTTLTIFLLGTGNASAILVVFIGTVFHLIVATADSVRRVPSGFLDLAHTMGFSPFRRFWKVIVPASAPMIFDNLRIAVGWAWSYVTLAEIMGTSGGLGHAIEVSRRYIRTDQVLLWIMMVGFLGLISDTLMRWLGRRWFRWSL